MTSASDSPLVPDRRSALYGRLQPWRRRLVFWCGAIATGAVAVLFAFASDRAQRFFIGTSAAYPVFAWVAPPVGFALIVWVTRRAFPGAQGSGIPQTIAALSVPPGVRRHRLLSPRIAFGKVLFTVMALGCGASVGREGPTVQVGASVMHALRRWARFPAVDVDRGLILAGGAAGIAAAFNTPLAGIVFAIEELSRSFEERTSGTILTAVLLAGVAAMALAGNYSYFGTTSVSLGAPRDWFVVAVAGVVGGGLGGVYARAMLVMQRHATSVIGRYGSEASVVLAFACGLGVAAAGWISHGTTFGTGYAEARALVQQEHAAMPGFTALKALSSLLSYASGLPGGIFAPSLSIGAALGGEIQSWLPSASGAAIVVLTMGAFFAGVVQASLTALVIVLEMTSDRGLTLPLMAAIFIARGVSALVCREPLYRALSASFLHTAARRPHNAADPRADA